MKVSSEMFEQNALISTKSISVGGTAPESLKGDRHGVVFPLQVKRARKTAREFFTVEIGESSVVW